MDYKIVYISEKPLFDNSNSLIQFFKVLDTDYPYRLRTLDCASREVGPVIKMYKSYAKALEVFLSKTGMTPEENEYFYPIA